MNYTKESIQDLIATNNKAVCRAVVAIYKRQTDMEKNAQATLKSNGVGFTSADARKMTSLAEWILSKGFLTPNQLFLARKRMPKYWRQLIEVAQEDDAKKAAQAAGVITPYQKAYIAATQGA